MPTGRPSTDHASDLLTALHAGDPVVAAELRPPRAELDDQRGMDAWIDTYHAVRGLSRAGTFVFVTDSAVGAREEDPLRHLVTNLGPDAPRGRVVPFLTCKHSMPVPARGTPCGRSSTASPRSWCSAATGTSGRRAAWSTPGSSGARSAARQPGLVLGGWANPHADPARQVDFLLDAELHAEFFLTQIVSHHDRAAVERFSAEMARRRAALPGLFGVFYYRSANPRTLETLRRFLPVPVEALAAEFGAGATPAEVCARTIRIARRGRRAALLREQPAGDAGASHAAGDPGPRAGVGPAPDCAIISPFPCHTSWKTFRSRGSSGSAT